MINRRIKDFFSFGIFLIAQPCFAEEFYPVDTPHADGWELALEEVVAYAQQEPNRTVVSTGFQESLEIAMRGFPVFFASQKPALAKSFQKLIEIAQQESDFNMFLQKVKETFTDGRKPVDMKVISGIDSEGKPIFVLSNDSQRPQNKTVDRFIEGLDRYSQQDFDQLRKSIAEGRVRAESIDWFHPQSGAKLRDALRHRRASVFYASDTVRESLIESGYAATDASSIFHQNAYQVLAEHSRNFFGQIRLESLGVHSHIILNRSGDPSLFYLHERTADRESFARTVGREPSDFESLILRSGISQESSRLQLSSRLNSEQLVGDLINRRVAIQRKGSQQPALTGLLLELRHKEGQPDSLVQALIAYPSNNDFGHAITEATIDLNQTNLQLARDETAQHLERTRISFHQQVLETSIPVSDLIGKKFSMRSRKTGKIEEIRLQGFIDLFTDRRTQSTFLIARAAERLGGFVLIDTSEHIIQGPIQNWDSHEQRRHDQTAKKSCSTLLSRLFSILPR